MSLSEAVIVGFPQGSIDVLLIASLQFNHKWSHFFPVYYSGIDKEKTDRVLFEVFQTVIDCFYESYNDFKYKKIPLYVYG